MTDRTFDLVILGGGLSGGLIALALAAHRPDLRLAVVERGEKLGGTHVWSFFGSDIPAEGASIVEPLIAARWQGYDVKFPARARTLSTPYASATSERLDLRLREVLGEAALFTGAEAVAADAASVTLADGRRIEAAGVIDARGARGMPHMAGGWQKFLGLTLTLTRPHGLTRPIVMDAAVEQVDGYRFVYCLPFSPTEVFVEDTYYSDGPELDREALRGRIEQYAQARGWQIASAGYEETGVLPVIAAGDFDAFWRAGAGVPARAGARAALVHPLTSYSLPDALRFALHVSALDNLSGEALGRATHEWAANHWRQGRFYRMLTRMLFAAARPAERWRVLQRFYGLHEDLIERFYAGRSTPADMVRVLAGKPPVPLGAAMMSLLGGGRPLSPLGDTL